MVTSVEVPPVSLPRLSQDRARLEDGLLIDECELMDKLIESAAAHTKDVASELSALTRHRAVLVRDATHAIETLSRSSEYALVSAGVTQYEGFAEETEACWSVLRKRAATLVERCKGALKDICASEDLAEIEAALSEAAVFGDKTVEEARLATDRVDELLQTAREALKSMSAEGVGTESLKAMHGVLGRFGAYPEQVRAELDGLKTKHAMLTARAVDEIGHAAASTANKVEAVDALLEKYRDTGSESVEVALRQLRERHDALSTDMVERLGVALFSEVPTEIMALLEEAATFSPGRHLEHCALAQYCEVAVPRSPAMATCATPRDTQSLGAACGLACRLGCLATRSSAQPFNPGSRMAEAADQLTKHLASLTEAATNALTDALADSEPDPRTLRPLATQYAEFEVVPEVATLLGELRKTMGALQQTMRDKLRAALAQTQLAPMREALDEARKFELGDAVLVAEVSAVQRKFDALSKAIVSEIKALLNTEDVAAIKARPAQ